jgi:hypothetical protein
VAFSYGSDINLTLLHNWRRLRVESTRPEWREPFTWYVLQNRPSLRSDIDLALITCETPALVKLPGRNGWLHGPDLEAVLLYVFRADQYERWRDAEQQDLQRAKAGHCQ